MNDIKDVKPLINLPVIWWWLVILSAVILGAAGLAYFLWRRRAVASGQVPLQQHAPWEIALERMAILEAKQYPAKGQFKPYYIELADIIRHYLEGRFRIKAPEMTTEEFLSYLRLSAALKDEHKQALRDFLNGCDMVKFAKHEPSVQDAAANFQLAKRLIEETRDGI